MEPMTGTDSSHTMETYQLLGKLAAQGQFSDVTFTWMDR